MAHDKTGGNNTNSPNNNNNESNTNDSVAKVQQLAGLLRDMNVGGRAAGKVLQTVVGGAGKLIAAHPGIALRGTGVGVGLSGIKDIKSYTKGEDRTAGTLIKGIAKTALGAGLLIYNDQEWYTQCGEPEIARNTRRPMDPVYLENVTLNATKFGIGKVVDLHVSWKDYADSLAFNTAMFEFYVRIRQAMRGRNLPYSEEHIKHFIVDSIAILTYTLQVMRQLSFINYNPEDCPSFRYLWNKIADSTDGYGPVHLHDLEYYDSVRMQLRNLELHGGELPTTITLYETLINALEGTLIIPNFVGKFLGHYFGNVFRSDNDPNAQYITLRIDELPICVYDGNTFDHYGTLDMSTLSMNEMDALIRQYQTRYGSVATDLKAISLFTAVTFPRFKDMQCVTIYDRGLIQSLINGYTSNSAVENNYIRLDQLDPDENIDEYTQFLFLNPLQSQDERLNKLYTPVFAIDSMIVKYISDDVLNWGEDLAQGFFDYSEPFGIALQTDIASDIYANINTDKSSDPITDISTDKVTANGATAFSINLGCSAGYLSSRRECYGFSASREGEDPAYTYSLEYEGYTEGRENVGYIKQGAHIFTPVAYLQGSDGGLTYVVCAVTKCVDSMSTTSKYGNCMIPLSSITEIVPEEGQGEFQAHVKSGRSFSIIGASDAIINGFISSIGIMDTTTQFPMKVDGSIGASQGQISGTIIETDSIEATYTKNIQNGKYYAVVCSTLITNISYRYGLLTQVSQGGVQITKSFAGLVPYLCDQLDFHIPVIFKQTIHLVVNGVEQETQETQAILVKENYIPYIYDVRDLSPMLYTMFRSLFMGKLAYTEYNTGASN